MKTINFKNKEDEQLIFYLHPLALALLFDIANTCLNNGYTLTITQTLTDLNIDKKEKRVSSSHRTGRAFDLRTSDMPDNLKQFIKIYFTDKYAQVAARNKDNENVLIVDELDHLHLQISARFARPEYASIQTLIK